MSGPIRLLVVDDSMFVRLTLARRMAEEPDIDVVDTAADGLDALEKVQRLRPDVITLDIEMPRLDGLETLRRIMARCPRPVIMLSTLTQQGARETFRALAYGAVDFVPKPSALVQVQEVLDALKAKVRAVAGIPPERLETAGTRPFAERTARQSAVTRPISRSDRVIVIGASTGGPRALSRLLGDWQGDLPAAVAIVQHMPPQFTGSLAERLNRDSPLTVQEAGETDRLMVGKALLAPGGRHLGLQRDGSVLLSDAPPRNHVRPAVDVTFEAAARWYGERAVAVVLTGMGCDGTSGARRIKAAGGTVLAEAEDSCVVYGMPRSVVEAGLADRVVRIEDMATEIAAVVESAAISEPREFAHGRR